MSETDKLAFAGVVCARICHDLAGTLGALAASLDMMAEAPDPEALALAQDCARELTDRLRVLRAAWGAGAEVGDLAALLPGLPNIAKLKVSLEAVLEDDSARQFAACLLLAAAAALPMGGAIWLGGAGRHLRVRVEGRRAAWPPGLLDSPDPPLEARGVAAAMARLQAGSLGVVLRLVSELEIEAA